MVVPVRHRPGQSRRLSSDRARKGCSRPNVVCERRRVGERPVIRIEPERGGGESERVVGVCGEATDENSERVKVGSVVSHGGLIEGCWWVMMVRETDRLLPLESASRSADQKECGPLARVAWEKRGTMAASVQTMSELPTAGKIGGRSRERGGDSPRFDLHLGRLLDVHARRQPTQAERTPPRPRRGLRSYQFLTAEKNPNRAPRQDFPPRPRAKRKTVVGRRRPSSDSHRSVPLAVWFRPRIPSSASQLSTLDSVGGMKTEPIRRRPTEACPRGENRG